MRRLSLRLRVAFTIAGFGALVGLLLAIGIYLAIHEQGQRLMDETLRAEVQDYFTRLARNPSALLPSTLTLSAYDLNGAASERPIPPGIRKLGPGRHQVELESVPHLAMVLDHGARRYAFLFNETEQLQRERHLLYSLLSAMLLITLIASLGGMWLARQAVAPLTNLAKRVAASEPPGTQPFAARLDEVEELADIFDRYLARIRGCVERERAFTADVSHELRTPLTIIRGAAEVLSDDDSLDATQRERIARIKRASCDMSGLTSALLLLAREESTRSQDMDPCSIAEVVRESVAKHEAMGQDRRVEIEVVADREVLVPAEKTLAAVVVDNLIGNAIQHAQSGNVCVCLEERRLVVSDTGKGIIEADREHLFQPYFRGQDSSGTGIGLSLAKRICDLYGWNIAIEGKPGLGTTAILLFTQA